MLVLDEPTASLDFGNQVRVLEKISRSRPPASRSCSRATTRTMPSSLRTACCCSPRAARSRSDRRAGHPSRLAQALYGVSVEVLPPAGGRHTCLPELGR